MPDAVSTEQPPVTSRLFFALFPDADIAAELVAFATAARERLGLRGKPTVADLLHVTVGYLGTFKPMPVELIAAARVAADRLVSESVPVEFDTLGSFESRRHRYPLVLRGGDNGPLRLLHRQLTESLLATRAITGAEPFEPHLALLRDRTLVAAEAVAPVRWTARELVLVHSLPGEGRYDALQRWPLGSGHPD